MWFSFLEGVKDRGTRAFPIYRVSRPIKQILNSRLPGTDTSLPSNKWGLLKPLTNNNRLTVVFRTVLTKFWCIIWVKMFLSYPIVFLNVHFSNNQSLFCSRNLVKCRSSVPHFHFIISVVLHLLRILNLISVQDIPRKTTTRSNSF